MGSYLARPFKNFNVESRAHRLIGKEKPQPAPMHPGTKEALTGLMSKHPEIQEEIYKRDDGLLSRLKEVYVDSTDPLYKAKQDAGPSNSEEFRTPKQTMNGGFLNIDVDSIPKGKISVVEVLTLLNDHKQSPKIWTVEKIAKEYALNITDSRALLEYFRTFDLKIIKPLEDPKIDDK